MSNPNTCAVSITDFSPSVVINSVFLTPDIFQGENATLTTNLSLREAVVGRDGESWLDNAGNFQHFRLRIITCLKNDQGTNLRRSRRGKFHSIAASLDFIAQRFNEYHTLAGAGITLSPEEYVQKLTQVLITRRDQLANDGGGPMDPLPPGSNLRSLYNQKGMPFNNFHGDLPHQGPNPDCRFYTGFLNNVIVYDRPIIEMLPPLEAGALNPREVQEVVNNQSQISDTGVRTGEQTFVYRTVGLNTADIQLGPSFRQQSIGPHLGMYAFIYFDYASYVESLEGIDIADTRNAVPALFQGMGNIATATILGQKTIFEPLLGIAQPAREERILRVEDGEVVEDEQMVVEAQIVNWGMV